MRKATRILSAGISKLMAMSILGIIAVSIILLPGCTSNNGPGITDTATSLIQAKLADSLMQSGVVDDAVLSVELSNAEIDVYIAALDQYADFREQWNNPGAEMYLLLDSQYAQLYQSYMLVVDIVRVHWAEYPPPVQTQLRAYQGYARAIDESVTMAINSKNRHEALNSALELGVLIANIAAL